MNVSTTQDPNLSTPFYPTQQLENANLFSSAQALALVIREFSLKYHLEVVAISVDEVLLEIFPESKLDNGVSQQFAIEIFPALYLINPKTKYALPIAYRLVSVDQIERNITLQFDLLD